MNSCSFDLFRIFDSVSALGILLATEFSLSHAVAKMSFLGSNLGILMDPFVSCLVEVTSSKFNVQHIENYHNFPHFQVVCCCFVLIILSIKANLDSNLTAIIYEFLVTALTNYTSNQEHRLIFVILKPKTRVLVRLCL